MASFQSDLPVLSIPDKRLRFMVSQPSTCLVSCAVVGIDEEQPSQSLVWPSCELTVSFLPGTTEQQKERVLKIARQWCDAETTDLRFLHKQWNVRDPANIRVSIEELSGCDGQSVVGTDARAISPEEPTMRLSPSLESSTILHEFGHALGLQHEHQSPSSQINWNRAVVIRELGMSEREAEVNVFQRARAWVFSEFDSQSIMLYAFPAHWTLDGQKMDQNETLSRQDRLFASLAYATEARKVTQLYRTFLRREPEPAGQRHWLDKIQRGRHPIRECVREFGLSPEFFSLIWKLSPQDAVRVMYRRFLGREAESDVVVAHHTQRLFAGFEKCIEGFASSPEFLARIPAWFQEETVRCAYQQILHREPDDGGLQTYVRCLASGGMTPAGLVRTLVLSPEFQERFVKPAQPAERVRMLYRRLLAREAESETVVQNWVGVLSGSGGFPAVVQGFLDSVEYRARFGCSLIPAPNASLGTIRSFYLKFLERECDPDGAVHWAEKLKPSWTVSSVIAVCRGFILSQEYKERFVYSAPSIYQAVRGMYLRFLNREPENEQVILGHAKALCQAMVPLVNGFVDSHEYSRRWNSGLVPAACS